MRLTWLIIVFAFIGCSTKVDETEREVSDYGALPSFGYVVTFYDGEKCHLSDLKVEYSKKVIEERGNAVGNMVVSYDVQATYREELRSIRVENTDQGPVDFSFQEIDLIGFSFEEINETKAAKTAKARSAWIQLKDGGVYNISAAGKSLLQPNSQSAWRLTYLRSEGDHLPDQMSFNMKAADKCSVPLDRLILVSDVEFYKPKVPIRIQFL